MKPESYTYQEPEDREFTVFPKGQYRFQILDVSDVDKTKISNIPMLPVKFEFVDNEGNIAIVYDRFVFSDAAKWKLDQFLKCIHGQIKAGQQVNFQNPTVIQWFKGRVGSANLDVEPVPGKTYSRNVIKSFVYEGTKVSDATVTAPPEKEQPPSTSADDCHDVPF